MHKAIELGFVFRRGNIQVSGSRKPREAMDFSGDIKNGDSVELKHNESSVKVKDVTKTESGDYEGIVSGLPSNEGDLVGLKLNDKISFEERHIFILEKK